MKKRRLKTTEEEEEEEQMKRSPQCAALLLLLVTACRRSREYSSRSAAVFTSPTPPSPPSTPNMPGGAPSGRQSSSALIARKASDRTTAICCWSGAESGWEEPLTWRRERERERQVSSHYTAPYSLGGGPWRSLEPPGCPWSPLEHPGASWSLLEVPGSTLATLTDLFTWLLLLSGESISQRVY